MQGEFCGQKFRCRRASGGPAPGLGCTVAHPFMSSQGPNRGTDSLRPTSPVEALPSCAPCFPQNRERTHLGIEEIRQVEELSQVEEISNLSGTDSAVNCTVQYSSVVQCSDPIASTPPRLFFSLSKLQTSLSSLLSLSLNYRPLSPLFSLSL